MQQPFRDAATGLYGEALFTELLDREVARSRRYARPLSLILGRPADKKSAAGILSQRWASLARDVDFGVRFADQRWVMVLPETDRPGASVAAERFRRGLEALPGAIALGVATYPYHGATAAELLKSADTLAGYAKIGEF